MIWSFVFTYLTSLWCDREWDSAGAVAKDWKVWATEIDVVSVAHAKHLVDLNGLQDRVHVVPVSDRTRFIAPAIETAAETASVFHFSMCNPPFFDSPLYASANPNTSYAGTRSETVHPGGEQAFVDGLLHDSLAYRKQVGRMFF